jgi:hypothetical protein
MVDILVMPSIADQARKYASRSGGFDKAEVE